MPTDEGQSTASGTSLARVIQVLGPILAFSVALVAFLTGVALRKKELACSYLGTDRVVTKSTSAIDPRIRIELSGQPIASLSKMSFVLRNTGSIAIKADDVKEALLLVFPPGTTLLNSAVEKTNPAEFTFRTALQDQRTVSLDFPLLNSGDEAFFSVYVLNSDPGLPTLKGRIVDVHQIVNSNESTKSTSDPFPYIKSRGAKKALYWALLAINALLALGFCVLEAYGWIQFIRFRFWVKSWADKYAAVAIAARPDLKDDFGAAKARGYAKPGFLFYTAPNVELAKASIPRPPSPPDDDWKGHLYFSFVMLAGIVIFTLGSSFIYFSQGGY